MVLAHCTPGGAGSRPHTARSHLDHCSRVLARRSLKPQTLPCHRAAHTTSDAAWVRDKLQELIDNLPVPAP